jgi:hypothetical protein
MEYMAHRLYDAVINVMMVCGHLRSDSKVTMRACPGGNAPDLVVKVVVDGL